MPTSVGPLPRSASTSSQVWRYLRVGLSLSDSQTTAPAAVRPIMESGVGASGRDGATVIQPHVGEEPLVALEQSAAHEGRGQVAWQGQPMPAGVRGASGYAAGPMDENF